MRFTILIISRSLVATARLSPRITALLLAITAWSGLAHARDIRPTASLRYVRGEGANRCPDTETIRNAVAARLGRSPWDKAAPRTIIVVVAKRGSGLHARVELRRSDGRVAGIREMSSPSQDCIELAAALQLAISIAIDPLSFARPSTSTTPANTLPERAAADQPVVAPLQQKVSKRKAEHGGGRRQGSRVEVAAAGFATLGSAPAVAAGITLQGRLRWRLLSIGLEGRIDFPAYKDVPGGQISSSLLLAGAAGCVHRRWVFGCGLFLAGVLRGAGHEVPRPQRTTLPYAAAGARVGVELPLYSILSLRFQGDLLATLTRITLREGGSTTAFWSTPPFSGALGAAVAGSFR